MKQRSKRLLILDVALVVLTLGGYLLLGAGRHYYSPIKAG